MILLRPLPNSSGFSSLGTRNANYFQPCVSSGKCSVYCFLVVLFQILGNYFTCIHLSANDSQEPHWRYLEPHLVSSPTLSPTNANFLSLPELRSLSFQPKQFSESILVSPPCTAVRKLSPGNKLSSQQMLVTSFIFLLSWITALPCLLSKFSNIAVSYIFPPMF